MGPPLLVWVNSKQFYYADTLEQAMEQRAAFGGTVFEPVGSDAAIERLQADVARLQAIVDKKDRHDQMDFPQVVCLCGSTRFMDVFHGVGWQLTLDGYIVLTVGVCKHAEDHGGEALGPDVAAKLDELHLRKIDIADIVMILNVDGYIGESTQKELDYAKQHEKIIVFLENAPAHATSPYWRIWWRSPRLALHRHLTPKTRALTY